ncbi:MAG TPA: hypothetical protein VGD67_13450, partial [Pseudonocardiaceae bacterium]
AGLQATWLSATLAPGGTESWTWNNANPLDAGYEVGYSPSGGGPTACRFETVDTSYHQMPGGERKFMFTIKNTGSVTCRTTVLLAARLGGFIGNSGTLSPGETQSGFWNFTHDLATTSVQVLGVSPKGAAGAASCQFTVVGTSHRDSPTFGGLREFHFSLRNSGSIACSADVYIGSMAPSIVERLNTSIGPGGTQFVTWRDANPLTTVYVPMAHQLIGLPPTCHLKIVRSQYFQTFDSDGLAERRYTVELRNIGSTTCAQVTVRLGTLTA